jgi:hypothetical protein
MGFFWPFFDRSWPMALVAAANHAPIGLMIPFGMRFSFIVWLGLMTVAA